MAARRPCHAALLLLAATLAAACCGPACAASAPAAAPSPPPSQSPPPASELVALASPLGQALLYTSWQSADYGPLAQTFLTQDNLAYCGVASSVMVLNSLPVPAPHSAQYTAGDVSYAFWTQTNCERRRRPGAVCGGMHAHAWRAGSHAHAVCFCLCASALLRPGWSRSAQPPTALPVSHPQYLTPTRRVRR